MSLSWLATGWPSWSCGKCKGCFYFGWSLVQMYNAQPSKITMRLLCKINTRFARLAASDEIRICPKVTRPEIFWKLKNHQLILSVIMSAAAAFLSTLSADCTNFANMTQKQKARIGIMCGILGTYREWCIRCWIIQLRNRCWYSCWYLRVFICSSY